MWVMHSDDEGATWAGPTDITESVNRADWKRIIPGPGVGIQMHSRAVGHSLQSRDWYRGD